jgi:hypothetical protein
MRWLGFARIAVLIAALLVATVPGFVFAATGDETTPGILILVPTIECIGAVVNYTGDNNDNCSATLEYRVAGGTWRTAPQMYADRENKQFRGSIFWLTANTGYEVRVTLFDADTVSGTNTVSGSATTRNDNPPSTGRTIYVATTGNDSNIGTDDAHPFKTIQKAADVVIPGDTVLVRAGTYNESVTISRSGAANNYITFRPYGSEQVTLDAAGSLIGLFAVDGASYIRIKGFTLNNTAYDESNGGALRLNGANNCILEDNTLKNDFGNGCIMVRNGSARNLVQRNNIFITQQDLQGGGASGIYWWKAGGANVFRNNNITATAWGLWDGMGGGPENDLDYLYDTDIYDNTIIFPPMQNPDPPDPENPWWDRDDGIQPEGGNINVRVWGNWIQNGLTGIASAPTTLGPTYIFRNVIVDSFGEEFKLGDKSYGRIYVYHNTYYTTHEADGFKQTDWGVGNIVSRNNIVHSGRYVIECNTGNATTLDFDYDNFYTTDATRFIECFGRWMNITDFASSTGNETHGISVADNKFVNAAGGDFHLQSGSPDVDKGVILVGFNDANSPWPYCGTAPDLGAYEYASGSTGNNPPPLTTTPLSPDNGGGGGGAAGVTSFANIMTPDGILVVGVNVSCVGTDAYLNIPAGTLCRGSSNSTLFWVAIRALADNELQSYPSGNLIITSRLFRMDPEGATFDPPVLLTIRYDRSKLPAEISEEKLTIATWDAQENKWATLESKVDVEHGTISAYISHFSLFTTMASVRPASFSLGEFTITPNVIAPDETTLVKVLVKNTGDLTGSYSLVLNINGSVAQSREVTLPGGGSTTVSFNFSSANSGDYSVGIGNLSGTLKVTYPDIQTTSTREPENTSAPAHFSISNLMVMPEEVMPDQTVTVAAVITNDGSSQGTYSAVLTVNGNEESAREVTLDAGKSETVYFILEKEMEGTYTIVVGDKTTGLIVKKSVQPEITVKTTMIGENVPVVQRVNLHWWLIGTVFSAVIIIGVTVLAFTRRRKNE